MGSRRWKVLTNLINNYDLKTFVEVGTAEGKNLSFILDNTEIPEIWVIDPYEFYDGYDEENDVNAGKQKIQDNYEKAKETVLSNDCVTHIRQRSTEAVSTFKNESIDIIFVDANHEYDYVMEDLKLWWPKVVSGGFMVIHDYTWVKKVDPDDTNDVIEAVDEFREATGSQISNEWPDEERTFVLEKEGL